MPVLRKSELHTKGPSPKSMIRLLKISTMISGHVSDIGPPMVESYRWDHHACEHKSVCVCVWVACVYIYIHTVHMHACMHGWIYVSMYLCIYVSVYLSMYLCTYVGTYVGR